jgi:hypothetical protein
VKTKTVNLADGVERYFYYQNRDITWEFDARRSHSLKELQGESLWMTTEKNGKVATLSNGGGNRYENFWNVGIKDMDGNAECHCFYPTYINKPCYEVALAFFRRIAV